MSEFFEFSNPNDLSRVEFESRKKFYGWNTYTSDQIASYGANIASLISKGMSNELSEQEREIVRVGKAELGDMRQIRVVENVDGRIIKSLVFVQDPQIRFVDTFEKSVDGTGTTIKRGTFLDTPLNRELGRVGKTFEKGEKPKSTINDEMMKAIRDKEEYKRAAEVFEKGMSDEESLAEIKKSCPDMTDQDYKNFRKAFTHAKYTETVEKALKMKEDLDKDPESKEE